MTHEEGERPAIFPGRNSPSRPRAGPPAAISGTVPDSLTTHAPGDGALPGKYHVPIIAMDVDFDRGDRVAAKKGAEAGSTHPYGNFRRDRA